ncbi:MAG: carboxypeptidase-like regulatory domain-containing protein [Planctomycetota bacterium]
MIVRKLFAAIALSVLALSPVVAQGTISGTVTDAATNAPIEHAFVIARSTAPSTSPHPGPWGGWWLNIAFTSSQGTYSIDVDAGNYDVTARKWGLVAQTTNVDVTDGATTTADFALGAPTFGTIAGVVTDADTGLPLENARVRARKANSFRSYGALTDAAGAYSMDVRTGDYDVTARKFGYEGSAATAVTVTDGNTSTVDIALSTPDTGTLQVTVNDNAGVGADGAFVIGRRAGSGGWFSWGAGGWIFGQTDSMGFIEFADIRTGDWNVRAGLPNTGRAMGMATVTDGMTTTLTITLP